MKKIFIVFYILSILHITEAAEISKQILTLQEDAQPSISLQEFINHPNFKWEKHINRGFCLTITDMPNVIDFSNVKLNDLNGIESLQIPIANNQKIAIKDVPRLHLILNNNAIREIPASFLMLTNLISLDISWNRLERLPKNFFNNFPNLAVLNISHNYLTDLPTISSSHRLSRLDISYNLLSAFSEKFYTENIKSLYLNNNLLEELPSTFWNLKLTDLNLSNNPFYDLAKTFEGLTLLEHLDLSNCNLAHIPEKLQYLGQLKTLVLNGNTFTTLPDFLSNLALTDLNLSRTKIEELPENFYQLVNLEILDLSYCLLKQLPENFYLPCLHSLSLQGNLYLTTLSDSFNLPNLQYLNLNNCPQLQSLPLSFYKSKKLKTFFMLHVPSFRFPKCEILTDTEKALYPYRKTFCYERLSSYDKKIFDEIKRKRSLLKMLLLLCNLQKSNSYIPVENVYGENEYITYGFYYSPEFSISICPHLPKDIIDHILSFITAKVQINWDTIFNFSSEDETT